MLNRRGFGELPVFARSMGSLRRFAAANFVEALRASDNRTPVHYRMPVYAPR
jgi:hypothetical protein